MDRTGPVFAALASFALGLLTLLAVLGLLSRPGRDWPYLAALALPAALLLLSGVLATGSGATRIRGRVTGSTGPHSTT